MERSDERVKVLDDILTGIACRSAYKFKTISAEELRQDFWIKVLEKEEDVGYDIDLNLVARICYDRVVDLQRYESVRNTYSTDSAFESESWSQEEASFEDKVLVKELLDIFPEGSKERIILEYWCTASGVKDFGYRPDPRRRRNSGFTENNLAYILGVGKSSSRSYKNLRAQVRKVVSKYVNEKI